jgi:uncharacterized protein (DUF1697 family)
MNPTQRLALLRGVNVGGLTLQMAPLRALAEGLGFAAVRSHIASGNLLFEAEGENGAIAAALEGALLRAHGRTVPILVLDAASFAERVATCPFAPDEGKHVHGALLWGPARIDAEAYAALRLPSEQLVLAPGVAWLHAPEGVGRSRLAQQLGRAVVGAEMTARNLNTLHKLVALSGG